MHKDLKKEKHSMGLPVGQTFHREGTADKGPGPGGGLGVGGRAAGEMPGFPSVPSKACFQEVESSFYRRRTPSTFLTHVFIL